MVEGVCADDRVAQGPDGSLEVALISLNPEP